MKIRCCALLLCLAMLCSGCTLPGGSAQSSQSVSSLPPDIAAPPQEQSDSPSGSQSTDILPEVLLPLGYHQLTAEEQELYDLLASGTVTPEQPMMLDTDLSLRQVNRICSLYQLNRQDYSWEGNQYYAVGATHVKLLAVPRLLEGEDPQQMTQAFEEQLQWYLQHVPIGVSDYEKVVAIATLLCQNVTYYAPAADFTMDLLTMEASQRRLIQEAKHEYGAIVNGQAICTGYSAAFSYLCRSLNIPEITVSGYTTPMQLHSWNLVMLDGKWYQVDVTWMDQPGFQDNTYLLATDFQLCSDHFDRFYLKASPEEETLPTVNLPICRSTEYNWFVQEGRQFRTAEEAVEFLKQESQTDGQYLQVQLANEQEYYRLIHDIPEFLAGSTPGDKEFVGFGAEVVSSNPTARTVTVRTKGIPAS